MLIVTNKTKSSDWNHILKEIEPYTKKLLVKPQILHVSVNPPREEINPNSWGVGRAWLQVMANFWRGAHERLLFHCPDFKIQGAYGFFMRSISTPDFQIKVAFRDTRSTSGRYNEFKYDIARTIVHELCHAEAYRLGIKDETHDYQDVDNLMGFVDKIYSERRKPQQLEIIRLAKRYIELLKKLMPQQDEPSFQPPIALHHSASRPTDSVKDVIGWSENWYNTIIREGEVHHIHNIDRRGYEEVCVVSQCDPYYTLPYMPPTQETLKVTRDYLKGREVRTHKQLGEYGLATKSSCPGNLLELI